MKLPALLSALAFLPVALPLSAWAVTPATELQVPPGFKVELLREAGPRDGSWICMSADAAGRLYIAPQGSIPETGFAKDSKWGGLVRATVGAAGVEKWERVPVPVGDAMGLLWAFDSLYVSGQGPEGRGIYRCKDTDGDGLPDTATLWKKVPGGSGEHGAHALVLAPDGQSIYIVHGNSTGLIEGIDPNSPYRNWGEDDLLPKLKDPVATFFDKLQAPYGYVIRTDEHGAKWELMAGGFRNCYDLDFNADGELFTYDSDMEWDRGLPWYRPTRVLHVVPGGEYGFREGSAKWPDWHPDSLPPVCDIGLGCPTGVKFGKGATGWPEKYQSAFFICDWTFGRLLAVHMKEKGASYTAANPLKNYHYPKDAEAGGDVEVFLSGKGMPLTDVEFGKDGVMYLTVGGRGTQAGLYRVFPTAQSESSNEKVPNEAQLQTSKLEKLLADRARKASHEAVELDSAQFGRYQFPTSPSFSAEEAKAFGSTFIFQQRRFLEQKLAGRSDALTEVKQSRFELPKNSVELQRRIGELEAKAAAAEGDEKLAIATEIAAHRVALHALTGEPLPNPLKEVDQAQQKASKDNVARLRKELQALQRKEERADGDTARQSLRRQIDAKTQEIEAARFSVAYAQSKLKSAAAPKNDQQQALSSLFVLARGGQVHHQEPILELLKELPLSDLQVPDKLLKLRSLEIAFARQGRPSDEWVKTGLQKLLVNYPARGQQAAKLNREYVQLLVWLSNPELGDLNRDLGDLKIAVGKPIPNPGATVHAERKGAPFHAELGQQVIEKTLALLESAPAQDEQIWYALCLRWAHGWAPAQRERYFRWFAEKGSRLTGGNSFTKFVCNIRDEAASRIPEAERAPLTQWLTSTNPKTPAAAVPARNFVKAWTLADLEPALDAIKERKPNLARGRELYAAAQCTQCHLFRDTGGNVGPDLTAVTQRFGRKDLLEAILDPNKVVSDQYAMVTLTVRKFSGNGEEQITGLVQEEASAFITLLTDPIKGSTANLYKNVILKRDKANVSLMPPGLLNTLTAEEVADLLAYMGNTK